MLKQRQVEVRYNPFDLSWVHIYYQGRFFQKAYPFKLGRWSTAAKSQPPPEKPTPTGIKPLQQLAQKHREQKQTQAQQLVGAMSSSSPPFTVAMFIHQVATSLGKSPEALHAREIDSLQNFWKTHQPVAVETVGIAMSKAILTHGNGQQLEVYLGAIKTLQLKWQKRDSQTTPEQRS